MKGFTNNGEIDYKVYKFGLKQYLIYGTILFAGLITISYVFYNSIIVVPILTPIVAVAFRHLKNALRIQRQEELVLQFKEVLGSMSTAIITGYSMENSIIEAYKEMTSLYGEDCIMSVELLKIIKKVRLNQPLYIVLCDFSERTGVAEIITFAQVYAIVHKSSDSICKFIHITEDTISERIATEREIKTIVNAKRYESRLMNLIPMIVILYVRVTSPEFNQILYGNIIGVILMTSCLICCIVAFIISEKILNINI